MDIRVTGFEVGSEFVDLKGIISPCQLGGKQAIALGDKPHT
jgi:hypothetical protein